MYIGTKNHLGFSESLFSGPEWTTGLLEWTTGLLEWNTGLLEWNTGLLEYSVLHHPFRVCILSLALGHVVQLADLCAVYENKISFAILL